MTQKVWTRALLLFALAAPRPAVAQGDNPNPYENDPAAIRAGRSLFGNRCAECHGADARGLNGPDLTALWANETRDERVFQTIRTGVSGSVMPSSSAPDHEVWAIVAYLKSVGTVAPFASAGGDAARGQEVFASSCSRCHRVSGQGGVMGPDLSRIARVRTRDAIERAIRDPSATVAVGYRAVTLVPREGERVRGATKGEDAFSIQIVDTRGRLQGYMKNGLVEVIREDRSLMPAFGTDRLSDADMTHVLAYMGTLR